MFIRSSASTCAHYPAILVLSCMAVTSCGTTLTLEEPVSAVIDVRPYDTLSITANSDLDSRIARQVYRKLEPSGFYRIQPSLNTSSPGPDVHLKLSSSYINRQTNYEYCHDNLHDEDHDWHHCAPSVSSYDIRSGVTGCFSSRRTGCFTVQNYYANDRTNASSSASREKAIDKLADQIAHDLLPRQYAYTVTIDADHSNPVLEQAAEACKNGNWTLGDQLAKQAAVHKPQSSETLFLQGIIERHKNNLTLSSDLISKAADLQPREKYWFELQRNENMQNRLLQKRMR